MAAKLVWMDLEMTGLDPEKDVIIEIATLITDASLNVIAEGPDLVIQRSASLFEHMDKWNRDHHTKSGLWEKVVSSTVTEKQAEEETLAFIKEHVKAKGSPLCGNSVWQDRRFLARYMRGIDDHLHYRLLDVSTLKVLANIWFPKVAKERPEKKGAHRAMEDIRDSIEELRFYRQRLMGLS